MKPLDPASDVPLYLQLSQRLRSEIEGERLEDGTLLPSEHEFCQTYGISRHTVRQALAELEQHGLVERRRGKGTFVRVTRRFGPRRKEGTLGSEAKVLGIVVPYLTDFFVSDIVRGAEEAATDAGYELLLRNSRNKMDLEGQFIRELSEIGLEGLVLFPSDESVSVPSLDTALARDVPCVTVDRKLQRVDVPAVLSDNTAGAITAVTHLLELKHRRIAFVSTSRLLTHTVWDRLVGYRMALERHGVRYDDALWIRHETRDLDFPDDDVTEKQRGEALSSLIERLRATDATAVFAVNDLIALEVLAACRRHDVRVPQDLAIVGFDDIQIVSHLEVPLTTVAQEKTRMGREAITLLLQMIQGERVSPAPRYLPTRLVVRRSCGARLDEPEEA